MSELYVATQGDALRGSLELWRRLALARPVFLAVSVALLFYTVLRGIRFPNIWSYTHYLFNYEFGFVRRGLIGTIVKKIDVEYLYSYEFFLILCLLVFLLSLILLIRLVYVSYRPGDSYFMLATALFLSSMAIVFLAHSMGYFDHIGLLATLVIISIRPFRYRFFTALILVPFCLFIHEAYLVIFLPVVTLSLLKDIVPARHGLRWLGLTAFLINCLGITYVVSSSALSESEASKAYDSMHETTDVKLRNGAFAVLYQDGEQNIRIAIGKWRQPGRFVEFARSLLVTVPVVVTITAITLAYLIQQGFPWYLMALAAIASLSPLLLNVLGWDMHRFNTLSITASYLVLLVFVSSSAEPIKRVERWHLPLVGLLLTGLVANLFATIPLFDGYEVKNIPFREHADYLSGVLSRGEDIVRIPKI